MADIDTLIDDIHSVLDGKGGWDGAVAEHFNKAVDTLMDVRLNPEPRSGGGTIRMSNVGQPCARKLWYHVQGTTGEPLRSEARLKFLYGDIIEEVLLSLAEAAGHEVTGRQDRMEIDGIVGHRDGVIDGMLVDVKSASTFGFKKFKENGLKEDDPFGYIGQLAAYLYAAQDDPLVTEKNKAAFLVMDKQHGNLCLDVYDLTDEMDNIRDLIAARKAMVEEDTPPARPYAPVPQSQTSPNKKLPVACSYCEYKKSCWPSVRTFVYSTGPVFLTTVKKVPNVPEV